MGNYLHAKRDRFDVQGVSYRQLPDRYLPEANTYKLRVLADSGVIVDYDKVTAALVNALQYGYYGNIKAWYMGYGGWKANADRTLAKWYDISTNNNDLTPTGTYYGELAPSMLSTSNSAVLTSGSAPGLTANYEAFAVVYWPGLAGDGNEAVHIGAASGGAMLGFNSNKPRVGRSAVAWDYEAAATKDSAYFLFGIRYDGSNHYLRINASDDGSSANAPTVNSGNIKIGPSGGLGVAYASIKELLILDTTGTDRTSIEAAINSRWSIY